MAVYCASIKEHSSYRVYNIDPIKNVSESKSIFFADTTEGHYVARIRDAKYNQAGKFFPARDYYIDFFMTDKDGNVIDFVAKKWIPIVPNDKFVVEQEGYIVNATERCEAFENPSIEKQMEFFMEMLLTKKGVNK